MAYRTPIPKDDSEMKGVIYGSVESMGGLHSSAPVGKSSDDSDSFETGTNFDKVFHGPTSYEGINVTFYKSRETGLKVMVADAQIPIVVPFSCVKLNRRYMATLPFQQKFSMILDVHMYFYFVFCLMLDTRASYFPWKRKI